jgi:hypothetical protein
MAATSLDAVSTVNATVGMIVQMPGMFSELSHYRLLAGTEEEDVPHRSAR